MATPPKNQARLTAKAKRELAARMKLDGHSLSQIAKATGYSSTGAASQAITEYLKQYPPQDLQERREIELQHLEMLRRAALAILRAQHIVVQHGKVVGRFTGWQTDPENPAVLLRDANDKPIATYEEIEDHAPALAALRELRQISESIRRLCGADAPVRVEIEDVGAIDADIEALFGELTGPPPGHPG